jgi:hypothetical protein
MMTAQRSSQLFTTPPMTPLKTQQGSDITLPPHSNSMTGIPCKAGNTMTDQGKKNYYGITLLVKY